MVPRGDERRHAREGSVTTDTFLVAERLGQCLPQCDTDVLDCVMRIYFEITLGLDFQVDQAVTRHLLQHVLEKRYTRVQLGHAAAIEIDGSCNLRFFSVTRDLRGSLLHDTTYSCLAWGHGWYHTRCIRLGAQDLSQGVDEHIVLFLRADGHAQTVAKRTTRGIQILHQHAGTV